MILQSHGQYYKVFCKSCKQSKDQDYFRGAEGVLNQICEACERLEYDAWLNDQDDSPEEYDATMSALHPNYLNI